MSLSRYGAVLRLPGAARFSAAGAIARIPWPVLGVGTVLMVQSATGSFAAAGRVSAVLVAAQAIAAPVLGRWVDRLGQRRVLVPMLATLCAGILGLVIASVMRAPEPVLWLCAAVTGGAQGNFGSYVRARWSHLLGGDLRIQTAFSLEAVIDEALFIAGPVVATLLATTVAPSAPLLLAAVGGGVGGALFVVQRGTEPPAAARPPLTPGPHGSAHADTLPPITQRTVLAVPGVAVVALLFVFVGALFGAIDVSTVSFATERGQAGLTGVLIACFALGSLVSGLFYGTRTWGAHLATRFCAGIAFLAIVMAALLLEHTVLTLGLALFVAGFGVAPIHISGNALVQSFVPRHRLTEALAWVGTATGLGASFGTWLAGARIDAGGSRAGFLVALLAGLLGVCISLATQRRLRQAPTAQNVSVEQVLTDRARTDGRPAVLQP